MERKKIFALLVLSAVLLSLPTVSAENRDTCTIKVVRTAQGFDVSTESPRKAYVRRPGNGDNQYYIFVADSLMEFLCKDTVEVMLAQGHQEGKSTCWSQKSGQAPKQDTQNTHNISTGNRRNWLQLSSMNIASEVKVRLTYGANLTSNISIRHCGGWNTKGVKVSYKKTSEKGAVSTAFKQSGDSLVTECLELEDAHELTELSFARDGNKSMVVDKVMLDGKEIRFMVSSKTQPEMEGDDIMFDTEISPDLGGTELASGPHVVTFECIALTGNGPTTKRFCFPLHVKEPSVFSLWSVIGVLVALCLLSLIGWLFLLRREKDSAKNQYGIKPLVSRIKQFFSRKKEKKGDAKTGVAGNSGHDMPDPVAPTQPEGLKPDSTTTLPFEQKTESKEMDELSDAEVATAVREILGEKSKIKNSDDLKKRLKKIGLNDVINRWNANQEKDKDKVEDSQKTLDTLMNTIKKGYIGSDAKNSVLDFFNTYNISTAISSKAFEVIRGIIFEQGNKEGKESAKNANDSKLKEENDNLKKQIQSLKDNSPKNPPVDPNPELTSKITLLEGQLKGKDEEIRKLQEEVKSKKEEPQPEAVDKQTPDVKPEAPKETVNVAELKQRYEDDIKAKETEISQLKEKQEKDKRTIETKDGEIKKLKGEQEKDKRTIETKDGEIKKLKGEQEKDKGTIETKDGEIKKLKEEQEKDKGTIEAKDGEIKKLKEEQEKDKGTIEAKDGEIKKLKEEQEKDKGIIEAKDNRIKEIQKGIINSRNAFVEQTDDCLKSIAADLREMKESVEGVTGQAPIFVSEMNQMVSSIEQTQVEFKKMRSGDWKKDKTDLQQIKKYIQDLYIKALYKDGWINNIALLLSYSRIPTVSDDLNLNEEMEAHGISNTLLERLGAKAETLLGAVDMGLIIPAVLATKFSSEAYEYKNDDVWIDKFFTKLNSRNFKGKIFDIIQVGYTINGMVEQKPVVKIF